MKEARAAGLDVELIRYPIDRTYADYYAKAADALSRVTTPFVVLADNDDLFIPDGLASAVEFLRHNPSYVACGQCAVFWVSSRRQPRRDSVYGDTIEWKCSSQMHSDVAGTASNASSISRSAPATCSTPFTVLALLGRQFATIRDFNPQDLFLMEQLVAFLGHLEMPAARPALHRAAAGRTRQQRRRARAALWRLVRPHVGADVVAGLQPLRRSVGMRPGKSRRHHRRRSAAESSSTLIRCR